MVYLYQGDCLAQLKTFPDDSVDAVVTDPPYGLAFMGKKWDYDVPSVEIWKEVLRVLKPGGHLLSFGGTRTYHRMVVNIEDAGFEIRDQIQWLYGSGFPKSHNISKGIDKQAGAEREVLGPRVFADGSKTRQTQHAFTDKSRPSTSVDTIPATNAAKQWEGWGTALKPANEPIVLARKPLEKGLTVAANVLKWGTGGLNIDACRVGTDVIAQHQRDLSQAHGNKWAAGTKQPVLGKTNYTIGRFPANLILDEVAAEMLDTQQADVSRFFYVAKASKSERNKGLDTFDSQTTNDGRITPIDNPFQRGETKRQNTHPTVKPLTLMTYLIKLITPPGGVVLDPFMGSGTTGVACNNLELEFVGIEREAEYLEIAKKRTGSK